MKREVIFFFFVGFQILKEKEKEIKGERERVGDERVSYKVTL